MSNTATPEERKTGRSERYIYIKYMVLDISG